MQRTHARTGGIEHSIVRRRRSCEFCFITEPDEDHYVVDRPDARGKRYPLRHKGFQRGRSIADILRGEIDI